LKALAFEPTDRYDRAAVLAETLQSAVNEVSAKNFTITSTSQITQTSLTAFQVWKNQLQLNLNQWQDKEQDEGALLRGALLIEAENWLDKRELDLTQEERDYIRASVALREKEQRQQDDATMDRLVLEILKAREAVRKDLRGINLSGVSMSGFDLSGADLAGALLFFVDLSEANLSGANLDSADLSGAVKLNKANLHEANLPSINLSGAELIRANLSGANLTGANLSKANLFEASLIGAFLTEANLSRANLSRVKLNGASLSDADLSFANLSDADLNRTFLGGVRYNDFTVWPANFVPDGAGAILVE